MFDGVFSNCLNTVPLLSVFPPLSVLSKPMPDQLPIIYSPGYDITLLGLQRLHPFESEKYSKVYDFLREKGHLRDGQHHVPTAVTHAQLLEVHHPDYLKQLRRSKIVATIAEVPPLRFLPNFILQCRLLKPMRLATGGTLLGTRLAAEHGWAINLSGGYHHAKSAFSSGFCFFSDIALSAYAWRKSHPNSKVMVVDLDAHQGNGFEAIFGDDPAFVTLDMYNGRIYPRDTEAQAFIRYDFRLDPWTTDAVYLPLLKRELPAALDIEKPDFLIYNAGTDILHGDPLGGLAVSAEGIIARDEFIFAEAKKRKIPLLKVLSGGYTQQSAVVIGRSIDNLFAKSLIG